MTSNTAYVRCIHCYQCCHVICTQLYGHTLPVNWSCNLCTGNELAFNHIIHEDDFINAINELQYKTFNRTVQQLDELLFDPFELNDVNIEHNFNEDDYDYLSDGIDQLSCKYFDIHSFISSTSDEASLFSLMHLNIRSIPKHYEELSIFLDCLKLNFSVIGLTETWFSESNVDCYKFHGYHIINIYLVSVYI